MHVLCRDTIETTGPNIMTRLFYANFLSSITLPNVFLVNLFFSSGGRFFKIQYACNFQYYTHR